ncbi:hypothetical protein ACWGE1_07540 [Streptomyces sp. NPDC054932]
MMCSATTRALILLAASPLVVTAVACSAPSAPATRSSEVVSTRPDDLDLPAESRALLADAERASVRDCMARQGFSFFYDPTDLTELRAEAATRSRDLTLDDVPRARREGFGPDPGTAAARSASRAELQEQAYLAELSPQRRDAWEKALMGPPGQRTIKVGVPEAGTMEHPTSGCFAEARTGLFGDYEAWARADTFVNARFRFVDEEVGKSDGYKEATTLWSICVRARNHPFATPEDARVQASTLPHDQALALAVATAECDAQVGRSKTHRSLHEAAARHWIERHRAEAADFRRLNAEAIARLKP